MKWVMFCDPSISDGLGGTGPEGMMSIPGIAEWMMASSTVQRPTRMFEIPLSRGILNTRCSLGRRMSQSMIRTRFPAWAIVTARLAGGNRLSFGGGRARDQDRPGRRVGGGEEDARSYAPVGLARRRFGR